MTSWVPSHVELTIHQARDLLLKTKNTSSVVYVSVVAEREKYYSPLLTRSSAPLWQYSTRIPLMSLDTTLHCTVRQKTSIKDKFLGLISIPLYNFTISSRPVTHWYKLGPKAGKTSSKLRGELLLTIKFLSNWVAEEPESLDFVFVSNSHSDKLKGFRSVKSSLSFRRRSMLKRTRSELKSRSSDMSADSVASGSEVEGERASDSSKTKKEKSGRFRLSLRKKVSSPTLDTCDDEFTLSSASLPSKVASSSLHHGQLSPQSESEVVDGKLSTFESLSRTLDPKYLPNGRARANTVGSGGEGEGRRGGMDEGGHEVERDAVSTLQGDKQTQTEKMSPALRYHNFRRRKRPWSMHTIPPTPQMQSEDSPETESDSKPALGKESVQKQQRGEEQKKSEVVTFRAKSSSLTRGNARRGIARSQSISSESRHHQKPIDVDQESSESCGGSNLSTPNHSPMLGSIRTLRNSDRTTDRSRSSGLGNITHSSTLPASIRRRAQSMSEATPQSSRDGKTTDSCPRQKSSHQKSVGLGPRVPLATSKTDSPALPRGTCGTRTAHLVSGDLTPKSPATQRGSHPARNPSPIQLESTLLEEDEEGQDPGSPVKRHVDQTVKSRVPMETESAAFKVDTRELQVTLEATPGLSVGRSIVAVPPQPVSLGSSSLPNSPSGSPSRQRRLPTVPGSNSNSPTGAVTAPSGTTLTHNPRKLPELPQSLTPFAQQSVNRAQSTSPIVNRNQRESGRNLGGRSMSTLALAGGVVSERDGGSSPSMTLPRRIKHTVSFKEKSTQDYEAIPALPPSLTRAHTLPRRAEMIRRFSEMDLPLSTLASQTDPISTQAGPNSTSTPQEDKGLHNIRTFDPRIFNFPSSSQKNQPRVSITNASFDETDSTTQPKPPQSPPDGPSSHARSVTPETPQSQSTTPQKLAHSYPGTPHSKDRGKRGGGLQAAMSRYQESKRKSKTSRRGLENTGKALPPPSADLLGGVVSLSAGNSPKQSPRLQRRAATHLGHTPKSTERGWRNPFSNLRRTQSQRAVPYGQCPHIEVDPSTLQGSTPSIESLNHSSTSSSPRLEVAAPLIEEEQSTPDSGTASVEVSARLGPLSSDMYRNPSLEIAAKNSNSNNERGSRTIATPTSLTSDTDSIRTFGSERTLVEASGSTVDGATTAVTAVSLAQGLLSLPPTRHKQTCSSLDSEGLGSLTSEEMEEAGPQDWAQWSKEDLVKEVILTKNKLHSAEEELKAVRGYLDNLLLRIMETNPAILSIGNL